MLKLIPLKVLLLSVLALYSRSIFADEKSDLIDLSNSFNNNTYTRKLGNDFIQKYPKSKNLDIVRFFSAETETNLQKSENDYLIFIRLYKKSDFTETAYFRICGILYLSNKIDSLIRQSNDYLYLFPKGKYRKDISVLLIKAYLLSQDYAKAEQIIRKENITGSILSDYAQYRNYHKRGFIANAKNNPADLYFAGNILEKSKKINEAFSAYSDVIKLFPKSPEAFSSKKRITQLMPFKPVLVNRYLSISEDVIDISPSREITSINGGEYYCVEIGPFYNLAEAKKIRVEIRKDYGSSVIVKRPREFAIYIGYFSSPEDALDIKIRLSEELGFNGHIVLVRKNGKNEYYSGE
ncbi:MAG: hypothetical protein KBH06_08580 [Spirochaetes bacterium]|nr:hypothetical protein [Spirochaetota bacterium]